MGSPEKMLVRSDYYMPALRKYLEGEEREGPLIRESEGREEGKSV